MLNVGLLATFAFMILALQYLIINILNTSFMGFINQEIFTVDGTIDEARSDDELLKLGCDAELPGIKALPEDDVALLVYTSGSTGDRKGASITHRNLVANVLQIRSVCREWHRIMGYSQCSKNTVYVQHHLMTCQLLW